MLDPIAVEDHAVIPWMVRLIEVTWLLGYL
jgi:hypothetical protein